MISLAQKYLIWECCPKWVKLKTLLFKIVTDPFAELTITLCIVVTTVFMAMEHHGMSPTFETMFQIGNIVSAWQPLPVPPWLRAQGGVAAHPHWSECWSS